MLSSLWVAFKRKLRIYYTEIRSLLLIKREFITLLVTFYQNSGNRQIIRPLDFT